MGYAYHCQPQAESFARAILPVPEDYPLRAGLPGDFRPRFARLCALVKGMYLDMAMRPESYGLTLVDMESKDRNLIRKAQNTIHRLADTLSRLSQCGEVSDHQLLVSAGTFRDAVKKGQGAVSNPIPRYELILSRLVDFGFTISGFTGKPFGKAVESFTIQYPQDPGMVDAIAAYCRCWDALKGDRRLIKIWPEEFHHHFYRFDYKLTADCDKIPVEQWLRDEARYYGYSAETEAFYLAFYEHSRRYGGVKFNGDYLYRSKRIARDLQKGYGKSSLSLKLRNMDRYMAQIDAMPGSVKEPFRKSCCQYCGFQGATDEYCKFRLHWTHENAPQVGCAHQCFEFTDFDPARVPDYWRLLELEYGLGK